MTLVSGAVATPVKVQATSHSSGSGARRIAASLTALTLLISVIGVFVSSTAEAGCGRRCAKRSIRQAFNQHGRGVVRRATRVARCESGFRIRARNPRSSASGLWQFLDSTWRSVTGRPAPAARHSALRQSRAARRLWRRDGRTFARSWACG
jgi:hypothetical protein